MKLRSMTKTHTLESAMASEPKKKMCIHAAVEENVKKINGRTQVLAKNTEISIDYPEGHKYTKFDYKNESLDKIYSFYKDKYDVIIKTKKVTKEVFDLSTPSKIKNHGALDKYLIQKEDSVKGALGLAVEIIKDLSLLCIFSAPSIVCYPLFAKNVFEIKTSIALKVKELFMSTYDSAFYRGLRKLKSYFVKGSPTLVAS